MSNEEKSCPISLKFMLSFTSSLPDSEIRAQMHSNVDDALFDACRCHRCLIKFKFTWKSRSNACIILNCIAFQDSLGYSPSFIFEFVDYEDKCQSPVIVLLEYLVEYKADLKVNPLLLVEEYHASKHSNIWTLQLYSKIES